MPVISAEAPTTAPREALWPIVRDLSQRMQFLPPEIFRDVVGDADHATFRVRVATGWADAQTHIVRVVEGEEVEERTSAEGLSYTARFRLVDGSLQASIEYELAD